MPLAPSKQRASSSTVEYKSVLRVRPLLKKERDDPIALEPLGCGTAVALHPPVLKDTTESSSAAVVVSGQDVEFRFDRVLSATASQEKVYAVTGQPMALQAMESLKSSAAEPNASTKAHLIIGVGLALSGTTYTCNGTVSKRKLESDGLVPRMLDSLFSQSKHHHLGTHKNETFCVRMTVLQVNQSKSNPSECQLYDLLQPVPKSSTSAVEQLGSGINNIASALLNNSSATTAKIAAKCSYAGLNEPVKVRQDPVTSECFVVNAIHNTCETTEMARECLQMALQHSRQLSHKKCQSHVLVQLQPALISARSGRTRQVGDAMAVLDMASCDIKQRSARLRDPNRADAHTAIMHCLKAIQHNQERADAKSQPRKVPFLQHQVTMLLQPLFATVKTTSVTLLVTVSPSHRDYVEKKLLLSELLQLYRPPPVMGSATGVVAASQPIGDVVRKIKKGHRGISSDVNDEASPSGRSSSRGNTNSAGSAYDTGLLSYNKSVRASAAHDNGLLSYKSTSGHVERIHSMTYSETSAEEEEDARASLPPPEAPGYKERRHAQRQPFSPQASAPEGVSEIVVPPPVITVDFPGVSMFRSSPRSSSNKLTTGSKASSSGRIGDETFASVGRTAVADGFSEQAKAFSYMKTINKVVHDTKKKGLKAIGMAVATCSDYPDLQHQVADLEQQNSILQREKALLEARNELLEQKLKLQEECKGDVSCANLDDNQETVSCCGQIAESKQKSSQIMHSENQKNFDNADEGGVFLCDAAESVRSTGADRRSLCTTNSINTTSSDNVPEMYDNPLFRHMATMNNQSDNVFKGRKAKARATHSYENDAEDAYVDDEIDENDPKHQAAHHFDDQLMQHMAMMNNFN